MRKSAKWMLSYRISLFAFGLEYNEHDWIKSNRKPSTKRSIAFNKRKKLSYDTAVSAGADDKFKEKMLHSVPDGWLQCNLLMIISAQCFSSLSSGRLSYHLHGIVCFCTLSGLCRQLIVSSSFFVCFFWSSDSEQSYYGKNNLAGWNTTPKSWTTQLDSDMKAYLDTVDSPDVSANRRSSWHAPLHCSFVGSLNDCHWWLKPHTAEHIYTSLSHFERESNLSSV